VWGANKEKVKKDECGGNIMYENGKISPFETISGKEGGGMKETDEEGEFNYDIYSKSFDKCHNVPQPQQ
jgi:hypothetical protein